MVAIPCSPKMETTNIIYRLLAAVAAAATQPKPYGHENEYFLQNDSPRPRPSGRTAYTEGIKRTTLWSASTPILFCSSCYGVGEYIIVFASSNVGAQSY